MRATIATMFTAIGSLQLWNASPIELAWTLFGLAGIYFTWHNLQDARRYVAAIRPGNGFRVKIPREARIIAFGHYRNETFRLLIFLAIIIAGVIASVTPPNNDHAHVTVAGWAITMALFMIVVLLVAQSALDRRQRELLVVLDIERRDDNRGEAEEITAPA